VRSRPFEPLRREVSLLVLGTALWADRPRDEVQALVGAYLDLGGNAFDTGREYAGSEAVLEECLGERRRDAILFVKGAHFDWGDRESSIVRRVTPEAISADLYASLDALATDHVDVFMLHRDDPSQPVGPILEELNEHLRARRVLSFGASNWTTGRLDEAAAYAREHGLETFTSSSVQLSLATQNEPPWPETVSAHDPDSLAWYARTQLPLFAWSAQAAGYFAGVVVERVYESDANRERRRRATELAARLGAKPTQVALAWTLGQPFPTHAVIGPRSVAELRESVEALELELTPQDVRWLDLGDEDG
jgi:aryl-alcohol dehydrogenase-like predicted oxidoreductase